MFQHISAILAQTLVRHAGKIRLRWLVGLSTLPMLGVVAAFGFAPLVPLAPTEVQTVVQNIALPKLHQSALIDNTFWRNEEIRRGDIVASVLERLDVKNQDILELLHSAGQSQAVYQLIPGRMIQARTTDKGDLLNLRYFYSGDKLLSAEKNGADYRINDRRIHVEYRTLMKSGEIIYSFFGATDQANLPDDVALQMVDVFSSEVDFHLDLRTGDRFSVIYEAPYYDGEPLGPGKVIAAEFINQGHVYTAFRFRDNMGNEGYFAPDGNNLRKAFLRSPLVFSRISSGFTPKRFHPISKKWRAHKGVDYAARTGTPVKSTGEGKVVFAGRKGGYGNAIIVRHQGSYSTLYGHLSRFVKGLRTGQRVNQGQIIGYVGMTGWATGPHLHYEFLVNGVQSNPLKVKLPTGLPVAQKDMEEFHRLYTPFTGKLALLRQTNLALLE
jgi:murein DD-endopeptidase MepM/ murein hydrolase activator NlpD